MAREQKFKEMEGEIKEQLEKGNIKELAKSKNPIMDLMKDLKNDPEFRPYLVPIPDYGAVNCLISMKVLRELQKLNDKS
jgi:hypothetical protein